MFEFPQICQKIKQPGWHVQWDKHAQVPFAVRNIEWLTFDNLASVQAKLEYVLHHNLGGAMIWEVNGDDWHGHCGQGKFPLMKSVAHMLNHGKCGFNFEPFLCFNSFF